MSTTRSRKPPSEARRPGAAHRVAAHPATQHPILDLQRQAGNAAVAQLLSVQRDGPTGTQDPGHLHIEAHEVPAAAQSDPPPGAATATPPSPAGATGATAASGGSGPGPGQAHDQGGAAPTAPTTQAPTSGGGQATPPANPTTRQYQVQYAFQGQATQATGAGVPRGQGTQTSDAHQVAVALNVSHHDDSHAGREDNVAVQGTIDAQSGNLTGVNAQVQEAFVSPVFHHLQGQVFGNASAGASADATGGFRPTVGIGAGAQGALVINDHMQVWVQVQDTASLSGPGGAGHGGWTAANNEQAAAGITVSW
ncbi:MAG TPA: hypothetical protein VKI19_08675 [Acidimicrobiales bacterium]|nr:hypothetical protein [Acidimicrobiales bacterium]